MNRILVDQLGEVGGTVLVDGPGSHHLLRVMRVARGAAVLVADRVGGRARCTLVDVRDGRALLRVDVAAPAPRIPARVVVLGSPRPAALEEALAGGTEAGVTEFRLVLADRTPPGALRPDRVDRVLRAAVTQCGRADVPVVRGPRALADSLAGLPPLRFVATPGGAPVAPTPADAALAVGPEGGWSPAEQDALEADGFLPVDLGPFLLRTPTAVAVAVGRLWAPPTG